MLADAFYFLFIPKKADFPLRPMQQFSSVMDGVFIKANFIEKEIVEFF